MLETAAAKWLAGVLVAVGLFAGGFLYGHHVGGAAATVACQAKQIVQQGAVIKHDTVVVAAAATQASAAQAVGVQVVHDTEIVHDKAKAIIIKIPVYVPSSADAGCTINAGFVRVWNSANGVGGGGSAGAHGGQQLASAAKGVSDLQLGRPAPGR